MAILTPAPFRDLVTRLFREPQVQGTLFELPRRRWYLPPTDTPDLTVRVHGNLAGNPAGPAAGPHTQMAQNILLSYVAGGRVLELKTVQVNDALEIPRPCIDMATVGFNVEWSQELRLEESLREYVAGSMLIEMFRHAAPLGGEALRGPAGEVLFDVSVGYDLAGIRSDKLRRFLDQVRDARDVVESLRREIPREHAAARKRCYPTRLSDSLTLSTFHGCPPEEIERIVEYLLGDCGFHVVVKFNPTLLGRERLEHLLHDVMGYTELRVPPEAYAHALPFEEAVALTERLNGFAARAGRRFGVKFTNTLEVENRRGVLPSGDGVMYLSGPPLYVLATTLAEAFRQRVGPDVPVSFSGGVDRSNFAQTVACGFAPVTVVTDLLRPGGYGRLPAYLHALAAEMRSREAADLDTFIRRFAPAFDPQAQPADPAEAAMRNLALVAAAAREDVRYRAERHRRPPRKIDSRLGRFDCLTCDKCLHVCPNAALFAYPIFPFAGDTSVVVVETDGSWRLAPGERLELARPRQIGCFADFCNACGHCETFCPEHGAPFRAKPNCFGSEAAWRQAAPQEGLYVHGRPDRYFVQARWDGAVYELVCDEKTGVNLFSDGVVLLWLTSADHVVRDVARLAGALTHPHRVNLADYHTLRLVAAGVLDPTGVNQINVGTRS